REDRERVGLDLDLAGREVGVLLAAPLDDDAGDADAELVPKLAGARERLGALVGLEGDLRDARSVAQVDEDEAAVIAARRNPAEEHDALAGVGGAQRAAVVGSLEVGEKLGHGPTLYTE